MSQATYDKARKLTDTLMTEGIPYAVKPHRDSSHQGLESGLTIGVSVPLIGLTSKELALLAKLGFSFNREEFVHHVSTYKEIRV